MNNNFTQIGSTHRVSSTSYTRSELQCNRFRSPVLVALRNNFWKSTSFPLRSGRGLGRNLGGFRFNFSAYNWIYENIIIETFSELGTTILRGILGEILARCVAFDARRQISVTMTSVGITVPETFAYLLYTGFGGRAA